MSSIYCNRQERLIFLALGSAGDYCSGMNQPERTDAAILTSIARHAMAHYGFDPDFSDAIRKELSTISVPPYERITHTDLRKLGWFSIDNDDSRDLDQLSVAENLEAGMVRILVAVADVDAFVQKKSAIDERAARNTTSVYTPVAVFPMLPEELSTGLSSLNEGEDRGAVVTDMVFEGSGTLHSVEIYRAIVHNHARLTYNRVGDWLEGIGPIPAIVGSMQGMEANLRLHDKLASLLEEQRHRAGALSFESTESATILRNGDVADFVAEKPNRAKQIIENLMIVVNSASARYLESKKIPYICRTLRSPQRWDRIVQLATKHGHHLPPQPNAIALESFLRSRRLAAPDTFAELSLAIVKLIGRGEYGVQSEGTAPLGHFGLGLPSYAHSTAPNRRFSDLVTQRLLKAAVDGALSPYTHGELEQIALQCSTREAAAAKVERSVRKSASALFLLDRVGEQFEAMVTGASEKGTWVRLTRVPAEGRLERGFEGLDVGDRLRVTLMAVDVNRGFVDFSRV